jgi:hypothetical protein
MAEDEEVVDLLDRIATLLAIGFAEQIDLARAELRADPVSAAVLDAVRDDWVGSGDIKRAVSQSAKVSEKTVQRSLAALVARGAVRIRGQGPTVSYRSAGVL